MDCYGQAERELSGLLRSTAEFRKEVRWIRWGLFPSVDDFDGLDIL